MMDSPHDTPTAPNKMMGTGRSEPQIREEDVDEEMKEVCSTNSQQNMAQRKSVQVNDPMAMMWEDSAIDREAKRFLKVRENGRTLALDILGHIDFFYHTLLMSHVTKNPFKRSKLYPALNFPLFERGMVSSDPSKNYGTTILDLHRRLVYPLEYDEKQSSESDLFSSPSGSDSLLSVASIDQNKYQWYPNRDMPYEKCIYHSSPNPKSMKECTFINPGGSMEGEEWEEHEYSRRSRHFSVSVKCFEQLEEINRVAAANASPKKPGQKNKARLSKALRRHTLVVLNPITEKQLYEDDDYE